MSQSHARSKANSHHPFPTPNTLEGYKENMPGGLFDPNRSAADPGSTLVSPKFPNTYRVSLKDELERKTTHPTSVSHNSEVQAQDSFNWKGQYHNLKRQTEQLIENKTFWKKLEKLLKQEGVDAMFAWSEAIDKYKQVKEECQRLRGQMDGLNQENKRMSEAANKLTALEAQIAEEKKETRVTSQKKCKGCEHLSQKEKEYSDLFAAQKKQKSQIQKLKQDLVQSRKSVSSLEGKLTTASQNYENLTFLKEQLQKKNNKMVEREKQWHFEREKLMTQKQTLLQQKERVKSQESKNTGRLHVELERSKESYHQMEKKYKRELQDREKQMKSQEEERQMTQTHYQKDKKELDETRKSNILLKNEIEQLRRQLQLKQHEISVLKDRHSKSLESVDQGRKELEDTIYKLENETIKSIQNKKEACELQLKKANALVDQWEKAKVTLELEVHEHRKANGCLKEELAEKDSQIHELSEKIQAMQEEIEATVKERGKYNSSNQGLFNRKTAHKLQQLYSIMQQFKEEDDALPKRRRPFDSVDEDQAGAQVTQKQLSWAVSELALLLNRHAYLINENQTLRQDLEQSESLEERLVRMGRNVDMKERAICGLVAITPRDLKDSVCNLLMAVEQSSGEEADSPHDIEQSIQILKEEGKRWMERHERFEAKLRRLEQENQELRRRQGHSRGLAKKVVTDYDSRDVVSRKDIRQKYKI